MREIKELLAKYKFRPNDLLGQNFLINEDALREIVSAAELSAGDDVLEIGSGIGNLTKLLSETGANVLAVEKDQRYFPILKDQLGEYLQTHTKTPKSKANVCAAIFPRAYRESLGATLRQCRAPWQRRVARAQAT